MAISVDGKQLAAVSGEHVGKDSEASLTNLQLHLWDVSGEKPGEPVLLTDDLPGGKVLAFAPRERLLAVGGPKGFDLWDLTGPKPRRAARMAGSVAALAFSTDGQWLLTGGSPSRRDESVAQLWKVADLRQGNLVPTAGLGSGLAGARAVAFTPDGKRMAVAAATAVHFWDFPSESNLRELLPRDGGCEAGAIAWLPDGKSLVNAGPDRKVRLWDLTRSPPAARVLADRDDRAEHVAVSADGKSLAVVSFSGAAVWRRTDDGWVEKRWLPHESHFITGAALASEGQWLMVGGIFYQPGPKPGERTNERVQRLNFWDLAPASPRQAGPAGEAECLAATPDGRRWAVSPQRGPIRLLTVEGLEVKSERELKGPRAILALSPDGKFLASDDSNDTAFGPNPKFIKRVALWHIGGAQPERRAEVADEMEKGRVTPLRAAFSPDGKLLAVLQYNDRLTVLDGTTGRELHAWQLPRSHPDPTAAQHRIQRHLAFAPDSRHLAVSNANGTICVLRLEKP